MTYFEPELYLILNHNLQPIIFVIYGISGLSGTLSCVTQLLLQWVSFQSRRASQPWGTIVYRSSHASKFWCAWTVLCARSWVRLKYIACLSPIWGPDRSFMSVCDEDKKWKLAHVSEPFILVNSSALLTFLTWRYPKWHPYLFSQCCARHRPTRDTRVVLMAPAT